VLDVVPPIPSAADYLWLSAYGFLFYYLFATYKECKQKFKLGKKALIASVIGNAIFLCYIIVLTYNLSVITTSKGIEMFAVIVAYPILDSTLMIPAIAILIGFRNDPLSFTPWLCESLGIFLVAVTDSWFAVIVLASLVDQLWLSALFIAAHFLVVAAGLVWYIKLLIRYPTRYEVSKRKALTITSSISLTRRRIFKRKQTIVLALTACLVFGILIYPSSPLTSLFTKASSEVIKPPSDGKKIVTIGALLPLTGVGANAGESELTALKIAYKEINYNLSKSRSEIRIGLMIEDTRTDPAISLEKLQDLAAKGVRIVIGPASSAELRELQNYAKEKGILLISQSSTAPSLSVVGSNTFRIVPDDTHQAQAISRQMWNDGVRVVVPMWRNDTYGRELVNAVREDFAKLGGKVLPGHGYGPRTGDFFASLNRINFIIWSQDLKILNSIVSQAAGMYGADKVGVYLVSFGEVVPIFIEAQNQPKLSMVNWYGCDSSVASKKLVRNTEAALFAIKTKFVNPVCCVNNMNKDFTRVNTDIQKNITGIASPYAAIAYDALWVAALTENATAGTTHANDVNYLKKTLFEITNLHRGITGDLSLNEAGNRKHGDYDFWAIKQSNNSNSFFWTQYGIFHS